MVRQGQLSKLQTVLESGAGESGWRRQRYCDWLSRKTDFYRAREGDAPAELEVAPLAPKPGAQNSTARSRSAIR